MTQNDFWAGHTVLITGVCGTIGSALLRQLSSVPDVRVIGIDCDGPAVSSLRRRVGDDPAVEIIEMDILDLEGLSRISRDVSYVIHAAAAKHVDRCEADPWQAVMNNVAGVQNVIHAAVRGGVRKVVFTSSDKAVEPTSAMGATKLLGEKLIAAAGQDPANAATVFATVRFGNVCGSSDSVIPKFKQQIEAGGPVTVTDMAMTRFIMSLADAADLVLNAMELAKGGEIFVAKMRAARIATIADAMIDTLAPPPVHGTRRVPIRLTGAGAGEKMYEKLVNEGELGMLRDIGRFLVIGGADDASGSALQAIDNSSADTTMSYDETLEFLVGADLIAVRQPVSMAA